MKTSQLAATVAAGFVRRGHVIAVERDEVRCDTLRSLLQKNDADQVTFFEPHSQLRLILNIINL